MLVSPTRQRAQGHRTYEVGITKLNLDLWYYMKKRCFGMKMCHLVFKSLSPCVLSIPVRIQMMPLVELEPHSVQTKTLYSQLYVLRSTSAKFQISSFNSLCIMSQTSFSVICRWCHPWRGLCLVSRLNHFILYAPRNSCAKYQVSSFNSLWDMVKISFWHVGGATHGGSAAWSPEWTILFSIS